MSASTVTTSFPCNSELAPGTPPDLGHWVYGARLHVCLTPVGEGLIGVYVAVPAEALPAEYERGCALTGPDDYKICCYQQGELRVDTARNQLRGMTTPDPEFCPAYRCGIELTLESEMVPHVTDALRRVTVLARVMNGGGHS